MCTHMSLCAYVLMCMCACAHSCKQMFMWAQSDKEKEQERVNGGVHMYNSQDMELSELIICLNLIGLKPHVMDGSLICVWPRAQDHYLDSWTWGKIWLYHLTPLLWTSVHRCYIHENSFLFHWLWSKWSSLCSSGFQSSFFHSTLWLSFNILRALFAKQKRHYYPNHKIVWVKWNICKCIFRLLSTMQIWLMSPPPNL